MFLVALLEEPSTSDDTTDGTDKPDDAADTEIGLRSILAVTSYIPSIETARSKITSEMETMVLTGLATLVRYQCTREVVRRGDQRLRARLQHPATARQQPHVGVRSVQ